MNPCHRIKACSKTNHFAVDSSPMVMRIAVEHRFYNVYPAKMLENPQNPQARGETVRCVRPSCSSIRMAEPVVNQARSCQMTKLNSSELGPARSHHTKTDVLVILHIFAHMYAYKSFLHRIILYNITSYCIIFAITLHYIKSHDITLYIIY